MAKIDFMAGRIGLCVELHFSPTEMREWTPQRIEMFFEGVAQVVRAVTDVQVPKIGNAAEAIRELRKAGLDAWDEVDIEETLGRKIDQTNS
jgi:hypothetical protein